MQTTANLLYKKNQRFNAFEGAPDLSDYTDPDASVKETLESRPSHRFPQASWNWPQFEVKKIKIPFFSKMLQGVMITAGLSISIADYFLK